MKFCYLDESGLGEEPIAVMAAVIVDGSRMHITKQDWADLLEILSKITKNDIKEFHARKFYSGSGLWSSLDGKKRAEIISQILEWLKVRKHKISFGAIDKQKFNSKLVSSSELKQLETVWCALGLHQLLVVQKYNQGVKGVKGHTIFIFDEEVKERDRFWQLASKPPEWTDSYYMRKKKNPPLDQMIDVPYFGNSEKIHLLQIADLLAYLVRVFIEIKENHTSPRYQDEANRMDGWMAQMQQLSLPTVTRYPKNRCKCADLFFECAPESLRSLK